MNPYYQLNPILADTTVNVFFEELLAMSLPEFDEWVVCAHKRMKENWDSLGQPPKMGRSESVMISEFNKLSSANVSVFCKDDELTPNQKGTLIQNNFYQGAEVDQFFENMQKVKMCYGSSGGGVGISMYDIFSDPKYQKSLIRRSRRHFRRDSFYHFSTTLKRNESEISEFPCETGVEWIKNFRKHPEMYDGHDFWICENKVSKSKSTGYVTVVQSDSLTLSADEVRTIHGHQPFTSLQLANININALDSNKVYMIRLYKKGQRIYPKGFCAYRIGYISNAVNFPAMTAKYLYEKYTNHLVKENRDIIIYDPSMGWGGRLLGALSVKDDRRIHYVGTDPNPENVHVDGVSKYSHIVKFFNEKTYRGSGFFSQKNTAEFYQDGSEVISENPEFHQYRGRLDLVFTSPPYFNREGYSTDANQSSVKFNTYPSWRDGFLIPTLETSVSYLRPGGYLLWNVADVLTPEGYLPLEKDSLECLGRLGMKYQETLKLTLQSMSGQQRLNPDGTPKCKNFCKLNGRYLKYEPIFVFRKPMIESK